ncbi:hypothetical protein [Curtobacterium sp. MCSS17_005]|uniref:prealbumin-like fold domain-containing protein n=1 Tax=Curtobacterium sp. MCSS17_005 TaxID=2175641 RepID=UPI000DA86D2C|nr:hypothetical protein [Curtobacterium sp. MCSS17_005]WIB33079.1 hypothetical protein DEJ20_01085 [Curtobacterium sp. MCSS17_005]
MGTQAQHDQRRRRNRFTRILAPVLAFTAVVGATLATAPATAATVGADEDTYSITFAARACDSYTDVLANKARNNLMESLKDLGADTNYDAWGIVSAEKEETGNANCRPLPNWQMTTGTWFNGKTPATQNLSTVTSPFATTIRTGASTPLLNTDGDPTGGVLPGAVTMELTADQLAAANSGGRLWIQGGTPSDPLNGQADQYGFAALRCGQDAVNGDNVEAVYFPSGQHHVFCFYYAVTPPPQSGTIVVQKQLAADSNGTGTFRFDGNISYADENNDGTNDFSVTASPGNPATTTFIRGEVRGTDPAWSFQEAATPGWDPPTDPVCTSRTGDSAVTIDSSTHRASVRLAGGDTVTCVVTNNRTAVGDTSLAVESLGGTADFPVTVTGPTAAPAENFTGTATTTQVGAPVTPWSGSALSLGSYVMSEVLPAPTAAGSWEAESATCVDRFGTVDTYDITASGQTRTITLTAITPSTNHCIFINRFTPGGSITLQKTSIGGADTFDYDITALDAAGNPDPEQDYRATATTTAAGTPVIATPTGAAADALVVAPAARYLVREQAPTGDLLGFWRFTGLSCGANTVERAGANAFIVTLDTTNPDATCALENTYERTGRFQVNVHTTADTALRTGNDLVDVTCNEGTDIPVSTGAGAEEGTSGPYVVFGGAECSLTHTATGAAAGTTVTEHATVTVDGGTATPLELADDVVALGAGRTVVVDVYTTITAAAQPEPIPTETPSLTPTDSASAVPVPTTPTGNPTAVAVTPISDPDDGDRGPLAFTGANITGLAVAAALLLILGGGLIVIRRQQRRLER